MGQRTARHNASADDTDIRERDELALTPEQEIELLKIQIADLKKELTRRPKRWAFPPDIVEPCERLHGVIFEDRGEDTTPRFLADVTDGQALSRVIRRSLWGVGYEETENWKRPRVPAIDMVSDEQYQIYVDTAAAVLKALNRGREKAEREAKR